jgi:hypothetical protein
VAIEAPRERIESMRYCSRHLLVAALLAATAWLPSESFSAPAKDQSRIEAEESAPGKVLPNLETPGPLPIPVPEGGATPNQPPSGVEAPSEEDPSAGEGTDAGEVPPVETIELTDDIARRALDAFVAVKDKYKDTALENYESLEQFVRETEVGKQFDVDIKKFGFDNVTAWNTAVTTVSFAYSAVAENQEQEIKKQIDDLKQDKEIQEPMKAKIIASLIAMLPSENNKAVIKKLMEDQGYVAKLKSLTEETE